MAKMTPREVQTITPFLNIRGAAEAIGFYKTAFGAEELRRVEMPDGKVGFAELRIGTSRLVVEEAVRNPSTQSSLLLSVEDADRSWQRAVDAGAEVLVPLANQFWGARWGLLADRWGNRWGIGTQIEELSEDELRRRVGQARGPA